MINAKLKLITVDGPAASGKSSLSRELALKLNWKWLSSGIFYRGLAYLALLKQMQAEEELIRLISRENWSIQLGKEKTLFIYKGEDITHKVYTEAVDHEASRLARLPELRKRLLPFQKKCFEKNRTGLVAEGRDCGTVVFPQASLKIYLTARDQVRAKRRVTQRGGSLAVDDVINLQNQRDMQDINRSASPLKPAEGALIIDTGLCSFEEMVEKAYRQSCNVFDIN